MPTLTKKPVHKMRAEKARCTSNNRCFLFADLFQLGTDSRLTIDFNVRAEGLLATLWFSAINSGHRVANPTLKMELGSPVINLTYRRR